MNAAAALDVAQTSEFIAEPYQPEGPTVIDCDVKKIFYGNFLAVRDSLVPIA